MHQYVTKCSLNEGLLLWWCPVPWMIGGKEYPDIVGHNNATVTANPIWTPSMVGMPHQLVSGATMSAVAGTKFYSTPDAFTCSFLFGEFTSLINTRVLVANGTTAASSLTGGWAVRWINPNIVFSTYDTGSRGLTSTSAYTLGSYMHVCCTFDRAKNFKGIYQNGRLIISTTTGTALTNFTQATTLYASPGIAGISNRRSMISDVRIYNRGLSGGEVQDLYEEVFTGNLRTFKYPWNPAKLTMSDTVVGGASTLFRRSMFSANALRTGSRPFL